MPIGCIRQMVISQDHLFGERDNHQMANGGAKCFFFAGNQTETTSSSTIRGIYSSVLELKTQLALAQKQRSTWVWQQCAEAGRPNAWRRLIRRWAGRTLHVRAWSFSVAFFSFLQFIGHFWVVELQRTNHQSRWFQGRWCNWFAAYNIHILKKIKMIFMPIGNCRFNIFTKKTL